MESAVRLHVFFEGFVQGVGFRYTAIHISRDFDVAGFVRNLSDGRVELVAEGDAKEVRGFVGRIREVMRRYIHQATVTEESPSGEFDSFRITY